MLVIFLQSFQICGDKNNRGPAHCLRLDPHVKLGTLQNYDFNTNVCARVNLAD